MIEDQIVEYDGRVYRWTYDESVDDPKRCSRWVDVDTNTAPPNVIVQQLDDVFLRSRVRGMFAKLNPTEEYRFDAIIRSMNISKELRTEWLDGRSPLECVHSDGWTGFALRVTSHGSSGGAEDDWPKVGLLRRMGYGVGEKGEPPTTRRAVLTKVFTSENLPNVHSQAYMAEWGDPGSGTRLLKMAKSIAAFCGLQKQKKQLAKKSIADWEEDLGWLKITYYDGHFRFGWPDTGV